jgi:hypothetical protein
MMLAAWLCVFILLGSGCDTPAPPAAGKEAPAASAVGQSATPIEKASNKDPVTVEPRPAAVPPQAPPTPKVVATRAEAGRPDSSPRVLGSAPGDAQVRAAMALERPSHKLAAEPKPVRESKPACPAPGVKMPLLQRGGAADPNELITVNFENVEIRTVLKIISEDTGINFIPHDSVTGPVTVMSPTPIRLGDLYTFLQSVLEVHGFATIEMDNAIKIVPKAEATKSHPQIYVGADPAGIPRTDTLIRQIIPLTYADATEISEIVTPILSPGLRPRSIPVPMPSSSPTPRPTSATSPR